MKKIWLLIKKIFEIKIVIDSDGIKPLIKPNGINPLRDRLKNRQNSVS